MVLLEIPQLFPPFFLLAGVHTVPSFLPHTYPDLISLLPSRPPQGRSGWRWVRELGVEDAGGKVGKQRGKEMGTEVPESCVYGVCVS